MADKTKIEWTEASWNPTTGCSKVSPGCKNCYALREWPRLAANPKTVYYGREFTDVAVHRDRLDQPMRWKKPRMIFVDSMSDLFHEDIPFDFIDSVFATMYECQWHTFQVLTKRPKQACEYFFHCKTRIAHKVWWNLHARDFEKAKVVSVEDIMFDLDLWPLPNVWLGVSVEDQETADYRIPFLLQIPAAVRFLSMEPLLEDIILDGDPYSQKRGWLRGWHCEPLHDPNHNCPVPTQIDNEKLDWVIAGGESGPNARPSHPDWFRSVRDQCQDAGIPFFFKQWGRWGHPVVGSIDDFVENAQARQWISDSGVDFNMACVGKKRAGRILDGREWNEMPKIAGSPVALGKIKESKFMCW